MDSYRSFMLVISALGVVFCAIGQNWLAAVWALTCLATANQLPRGDD